jgi:hypothetical protein
MFFVRRGTIFLLFLFVFIISCPLILEAAGITFKVDPAKVRLIIPASGSQAGTIKVDNQSSGKKKIKVYLEDWAYTKIQDGTKDFSPPKSTPLSCSDWISFNPQEFTILPYGRQNLNYVVRVPPGAQGGHYAVMFFESSLLEKDENKDIQSIEAPKSDEMEVESSLNIRLGILFYIEAKDTVKRLAELNNLFLSKDPKNKQLLITCDFKNTGNVDITAAGSFHIIDKEGMVLARGEFDKVYTFPGDTAKLTASWKDMIPKGNYDLILTIDLGKALEELEMGRGPVITKETEIEVNKEGEVIKVGELK